MKRALVSLTMLCLACGVRPSPGDAGPPVSTDGGLDLDDVSFLLPLPAPGQEATLLGLSDAEGKGVLLPRALYDGLPVLVEGTAPAALYAQLRVVGIRVDPCFPGTTPPAAPTCVKQLRLIAQPLRAGGADAGFQTVTDDATVHLFYGLSDADFDEVHRGLWNLKALAGAQTAGQPLGVHPVLESEGLGGPYGSALRSLVLRHCGAQTLTRVAFMSVATQGSLWRFGAFDVEDGALVAASIPRIGATAQGFQEFGTPEFRSGQLLPTVSGDDLDVLLSESQLRLTDERTLDRALTSALRIEHPARESPRTIDCASCHVASRARHNAEQQRQVDTSGWPDAFDAGPRFDLRRLDGAKDDAHALRAFGYFGRLSALSQRTINESAAVAEALSKAHP
jgi:hypothetical protein